MNLGLHLRRDKDLILKYGFAAFHESSVTYYAGPKGSPKLASQVEALKLLRHLEVAPQPGVFSSLRGFALLPAYHRPAQDFSRLVGEAARPEQVELVRRLGAAVGMVHSMKSLWVGPIEQPGTNQVSFIKTLLVKGAITSGQPLPKNLWDRIEELWQGSGASLVVGWQGWPELRVTEDALLIMDFSHALFFDPLWDFVRLEPCPLQMGIEFWDFFLQGYCATGELEANWREKVEVLYQVAQFVAPRKSRCEDLICHYQSRWWDTL
jgi:hypothetical protein